MSHLAILGGPRALDLVEPRERVIDPSVVEALHVAVDLAAEDWCYLSGATGQGPIEALEDAMCRCVGVRHALALSSGTASLMTALLACGVGRGDEVIVPSYTWGQTVGPVLHIGAVPVFADIDSVRCTASPASVADAISSRTKAIIAVHLYGQPADVCALRELAEVSGIALIEDCAQALGATVGGRPVGCFGTAAVYSFGRRKTPTGGEGGMLVTNHRGVYERAVAFSQHPVRQHRELSRGRKSMLSEFGFNFRMHPLSAVAVRAGLASAGETLVRRQAFWKQMSAALTKCPGVHAPEAVSDSEPAHFQYCPSFAPRELGLPGHARDPFVAALMAEGVPIAADPIGTPLHHRSNGPWGGEVSTHRTLPASEQRCYQTGLSLAPWLATLEDRGIVSAVVSAIRKVTAEPGAWFQEVSHSVRTARLD